MLKEVVNIYDAEYEPIADLATWRAMPTREVPALDPFLFLNHHGPQHYGPNNRGLPFGPHPHRGFETLTFVLQGDITHMDSVSGESVIDAGGIQWMTAGSGLIHAEVSSKAFKKNGGMEEVIQLWMNLPAKLKMVKPSYTGLQQADIPQVEFDGGIIHLVSGTFEGKTGPVNSLTELFTSTIDIRIGGEFVHTVPTGSQILLYVVNGEIVVDGAVVEEHQLVEFAEEGDEVSFIANRRSQLVFCYGQPLLEPVVSHGPFVMNTDAEIREAIVDYQTGKMGRLVL